MDFKVGERVVVESRGPGEIKGYLSDACVVIRFDSGVEMCVHVAGVKRESETEVRSKGSR
jgi:hypothetical protein